MVKAGNCSGKLPTKESKNKFKPLRIEI
jgi:hypothetical protein